MNYFRLSVVFVALLSSVIVALGAPTITAATIPPRPMPADTPSQEELEALNKSFLRLYAAGDYVVALDQAEKYEQPSKLHSGPAT
jgi:hypothetical protein